MKEFVVEHLVAPAAAGIIASLVFTLLSPIWIGGIEQRLRPPSCEDPKELRRIDPAAMTVEADSFEDRNRWPADALIDGDPGSAWVPADGGRAEFRFSEQADLQLVCVVNGNGGSKEGYKRADRIRTVRAVTDASDTPLLTNLRDLPEGDLGTLQQVRIGEGPTHSVRIEIVARWTGQTVYNPVEDRYDAPTGLVAFGEAEFYTTE